MSITLTKFKNNALSLTRKVRRRSPPKMESAEAPHLVMFIFPLRCGVNNPYPQCMPLGRVNAKIVKHCANIYVPL